MKPAFSQRDIAAIALVGLLATFTVAFAVAELQTPRAAASIATGVFTNFVTAALLAWWQSAKLRIGYRPLRNFLGGNQHAKSVALVVGVWPSSERNIRLAVDVRAMAHIQAVLADAGIQPSIHTVEGDAQAQQLLNDASGSIIAFGLASNPITKHINAASPYKFLGPDCLAMPDDLHQVPLVVRGPAADGAYQELRREDKVVDFGVIVRVSPSQAHGSKWVIVGGAGMDGVEAASKYLAQQWATIATKEATDDSAIGERDFQLVVSVGYAGGQPMDAVQLGRPVVWPPKAAG